MFSYEILEDDGVIVVTSTGQSTVEDYQIVAPKFFADAKSQGIRRALLDARKYQGPASRQAESLTFYSWMESRSVFDRIALVFHEGIRDNALEFAELIRDHGKDARLFPPEQYEEALDWLKGDHATSNQD
jgi:hypothetical protein